MGEKQSLRTDELAARWSMSPRTIRRAIQRGEIRATKIGRTTRIPIEEVRRLEAGGKNRLTPGDSR